MKWIFLWALGLSFLSANSWGMAPTSYRLPHPIGWMHMLPTGEMPGWSHDFWVQLEVGHGNVWNAPIEMRNLDNDTGYEYQADWAQTYGVLELGGALTDFLAFSVEVPYSHRGGGFLDQTIDSFHVLINSDRFSRPQYPKNETHFNISTNGQDYFDEYTFSGMGHVKSKLKIWWWRLNGGKKEQCPCGLSTSLQVKMPVDSAKESFTTGDHDYSALLHLGFPIFSASAMWLTSAVTKLGDNPALAAWPRREWHQMYEMSFDLAFTKYWGFIFQVRAESPFLNAHDLAIVAEAETPEEVLIERIASGWNSLVHWRGSQSMGFRYRPNGYHQTNFLITEDWGLGDFDGRGDRLYVNNAPDVSFLLQYTYGF